MNMYKLLILWLFSEMELFSAFKIVLTRAGSLSLSSVLEGSRDKKKIGPKKGTCMVGLIVWVWSRIKRLRNNLTSATVMTSLMGAKKRYAGSFTIIY